MLQRLYAGFRKRKKLVYENLHYIVDKSIQPACLQHYARQMLVNFRGHGVFSIFVLHCTNWLRCRKIARRFHSFKFATLRSVTSRHV